MFKFYHGQDVTSIWIFRSIYKSQPATFLKDYSNIYCILSLWINVMFSFVERRRAVEIQKCFLWLGKAILQAGKDVFALFWIKVCKLVFCIYFLRNIRCYSHLHITAMYLYSQTVRERVESGFGLKALWQLVWNASSTWNYALTL